MFKILVMTSALSLSASAFAIEPAQSIDLDAYLGTWYEQVRIPNEFQDNTRGSHGICTETSATYGELPGGKISVTNRCTRVNTQDPSDTYEEVAEGVARVVRGSNNTKLKVNFTGIPLLQWLGIGSGDYWILAVGQHTENVYDWALIGSPRRDYGWILARETLDDDLINEILDYAESIGYNRADFIDTRSNAQY